MSNSNYYRVTAPTAGVIGDIPVRVGDRVTRSTILTTVDDHAAFEVYVSVPVQQAPDLRVGLPVRLLDEAADIVSTNPMIFVAPVGRRRHADGADEDRLRRTGARFRTDQFVRAQIVWASEPGLTVPIISLSRINGQFFAYVVEPGEKGATVARQRAVEVGPGRRQRLRGSERAEGRRPADRVGHPEDRRRGAGPHGRGARGAIGRRSLASAPSSSRKEP